MLQPAGKWIHLQECVLSGVGFVPMDFQLVLYLDDYETDIADVEADAPIYLRVHRAEARSTASAQSGCTAFHESEEMWTCEILPTLWLNNQVIEVDDRIIKTSPNGYRVAAALERQGEGMSFSMKAKIGPENNPDNRHACSRISLAHRLHQPEATRPRTPELAG